MLNNTGFDLWADGYDKSVGLSDENDRYVRKPRSRSSCVQSPLSGR